MMVDEKTAKFKSDYQGKTYYFCAASCKTSFDKNPTKYVKGSSGGVGHSGGCCCGGH
jgi:YHS domain-containing protein